MIACKKCGRENEDHFNFCLSCGSNLRTQREEGESERACPRCGSPVPLTHAFCGQCGARIAVKVTSDMPPVPPTDQDQTPAELTAAPVITRAKLVLINPDGSMGQAIGLQPGRNVFGRDSGPRAFREDPFLSPDHVAFHLEEETLVLTDLDSLNGIFVRIVEPTPLAHLDHLRIGRQLLEFQVLAECEGYTGPAREDTKVLGAPWSDAWGRLVRISSPDKNSQAFLLTHPEEIIGRERGSIVFRDDGFVSARHARITASGNTFLIEDLRSSNGTFLQIRRKHTVRDGDLLLMGQQPCRVYLGD